MDVEIMQWMDRAGPHVAADVDAYGTALLMCDEMLVESVGRECCVVDPVGSTQSRLELAQIEGVAGMATSEFLEFDMAPAIRGGLYVDQVSGESAV